MEVVVCNLPLSQNPTTIRIVFSKHFLSVDNLNLFMRLSELASLKFTPHYNSNLLSQLSEIIRSLLVCVETNTVMVFTFYIN